MLTYYVYFNLEEINESIFGKFFKPWKNIVEFNLLFAKIREDFGRISTSLRKRLENDFGRKMLAPRGTRVVVSLTTRGGRGG